MWMTWDFHAAYDLVAPDLVRHDGWADGGLRARRRTRGFRAELRLLARRLAADRPTSGVCFAGDQMIPAAALGAEVFAGPEKEIGFAR
jgi:GMP synthase (glutamine-hydrolysing)